MIPPEFILEASATMIVGALFVVTLAQALKWYVGSTMFLFVVCGVVPFSVSAILVLLDYYEVAKWVCIASFILFALFLSVGAYSSRND